MTDLSVAARAWQLNFLFSTKTLSAAIPDLEALGLDGKEFFVLDGVPERPYPAELAMHLAMPKPSLTLHLKKLQSNGLITRIVDPNDLRRHQLALTNAGRKTLTQARAAIAKRYDEKLQCLSPAEQEQFMKLLEKLAG